MSKVRARCGTAILAMIASLVFATAALAQMPQSPWKKAAPFPEPDEELYGVAVNNKLYVIGGCLFEPKIGVRQQATECAFHAR